MGISALPETFTEGGLFEAGRYKVQEAAFTVYDYAGKRSETIPALHLKAVGVEGDVEGKEVDQYYKAGDLKDFTPSPDGKELIAVGKKTSFNKKSNIAIFYNELMNAGVPREFMEKVGDDVSLLVGMEADFGPLTQEYEIRGEKKSNTLFVTTKIHSIPGEAAAASATAAAGEVEDLAVKAVNTVLEANKGKIKKNDLPAKLMAMQLGDHQMAVVQLCFKDDFLAAHWDTKGGVISTK